MNLLDRFADDSFHTPSAFGQAVGAAFERIEEQRYLYERVKDLEATLMRKIKAFKSTTTTLNISPNAWRKAWRGSIRGSMFAGGFLP